MAFQMKIVRDQQALKFACQRFKHVSAKIQCDKMNTKFDLQCENDQIKWFIYTNKVSKSETKLLNAHEIACTYPSLLHNSEI